MTLNIIYRKLMSNLLVRKPQTSFQYNKMFKRHFILTVLLESKNDSNNKETHLVTTTDSFANAPNKTKETYLDMIKIYENRSSVHRRGHVEFIYAALKHMDEFSVQKDLAVYKTLIDVLPKGRFVPTNVFQAEFMHYPKQQQCIIDLLQQMEDNGVIPDFEMEDLLLNIFGRRGYPLRKYWRMMYWMPKFKNLTPWPLPDILPNDNLELAKLAISRITSIDLQSTVTVYQSADIKESIDDTWIVSGQSSSQIELLEKHDLKKPVYVEGSFRIWLQNVSVNYFILRTDTRHYEPETEDNSDDVSNIKIPFFSIVPPSVPAKVEQPTVHEQEDGTILAVCATGTSSRDSLLSWIRHLEKNGNPILGKAIVVFTLRSPPSTTDSVEIADSNQNKEQNRKIEDK